jgi:hypothetical protein
MPDLEIQKVTDTGYFFSEEICFSPQRRRLEGSIEKEMDGKAGPPPGSTNESSGGLPFR